MTPLAPHDIGVCPTYLMRGLPALQQAVLVWAWQAELAGAKWTVTGIARSSGMTPQSSKRALEEL